MPAEPEIVNILGEQVALEPTSFSPAEKFLVNFSDKYKFPEMTPAEELLVKKVFQLHFSGEKKPLPPCTQKEKDLLLKSITHRFTLLRNELIAERKSQSDSLRLRQILDHVQRLKDYIDFAGSVKECKDIGEELLGEALSQLTEDEILELLRQFVFFILQGQHPLEEFIGRDPNPRGFVARLKGNPIPNFQEFLDKYREKKYPVPQAIAQVLEATKIDLDAMKKGVDAALAEKLQGILSLIRETIPPGDPFWENPLWDSESPDIVAIVDALLTKLKDIVEEMGDCNEQIEQLTQDIMGLTEAQEILLDDQQTLQNRIRILEAEVQRLQAESLGPAERNELESGAQARIAALQAEITASQAERQRLAALLQEKDALLRAAQQQHTEKDGQLQRLQGTQGELENLRASHARLEEELRAAQQKVRDCEELQTRVRALERQVASGEEALTQLRQHAGELTSEIDRHLQEKARLQARIDSLEETAGLYNELKEDIEKFSAALKAGSTSLIVTLENIQRKREALRKENDPVLAKLLAVKKVAQESNGMDPTLATQVADILKDVQEELNTVNTELKALQQQVEEQDRLITAAEGKMEEGNKILSLVRAGRTDLYEKGFKFETDKDALEAAFKAVEAERGLQKDKTELESAVASLTAKNQALQSDMETLTARLSTELEGVREQLRLKDEELGRERETVGSLRGDVAARDQTVASLQSSLEAEQERARGIQASLDAERSESAQKLTDLLNKSAADCDEKLKVLRAEEAQKQQALLTAQESEKAGLQQQIQELSEKKAAAEAQKSSLQSELASIQASLRDKEGQLERQRQEFDAQKVALEQKSLEDCQAKLSALRLEEEKKREALVSAQGEDKAKVEARIAALAQQITAVEGERDGLQSQISVLNESLRGKDDLLAKQKEECEARIAELQGQLDVAREEASSAKGEATKFAGDKATLEGEIEKLKSQILSNSQEKREIFELVSKLSEWITSGAKLPKPDTESALTKKYKFDRILQAFEPFIPKESSPEEDRHIDSLTVSMSRCQLVFFMSYVYARNFPKVVDGDSSYQLRITAFLKSVQANLYKALDVGIPGKLEPVGAEIPLQLKSKYMVNLLLPLLKQMELVHESGKKGAEFLKFSVLQQDQLETLHKLHKIIKDALLQAQNKDIPDVLKHYVIRKTGNVDDDIHELFLRFYHETKTNREFPVVMYTKPDAPTVPKFTFGTEEDFEKFLSSPSQKSDTALKLATPAEKSLLSKPIFSFNILFYLFLFFVKDYLSSIQGELDKAGCPLPKALKPE